MSLIRYPLATGDTGDDTVRFTLYDDAGRLLTRVDGNDVTTEYTYGEAGGNLTLIHYPADDTLDVSFGYDSLGRRTSVSNNEGTLAYTYDDRDGLLSTVTTYTGLSAKTLSWTFNDDGSRHTMTTPAGTQTYGYDDAGRMTSLAYGLGTAAWTWLDNGWLSKQTLPNGAYTDYSYNDAGQLVGLANKTSGDTTLASYGTMAYRGTGDLQTVTSTIPGATSQAGVVDYSYDHKRQLTDESSDRLGGYGYDYANAFDSAGNATTFRNDTKGYNADNQLTSPTTFVYDGNGNPTTFSGTTLTFDPENRLTAYGSTLTAGYRGDNLRAWKQTSSGTTYFLYDGINVVCELDGSGNVTAHSVFGANGLLSRGSVQYQFDPLGDATLLLDGSESVTAYRLFDAWGNELSSGSTDPRGYRAQVGYCTDVETGLVALAYRYYAPGMGRFVNRDPIGYGGGMGLYAYLANNTTGGTDPLGLSRESCRADCWKGVWLAVGIDVAIAVGCAALCGIGLVIPGGPFSFGLCWLGCVTFRTGSIVIDIVILIAALSVLGICFAACECAP